MRKQVCDQVLVLERRVLGESDLIVVLLSKHHGKLAAVAPGGRKSRKRFGACLDLFVQIEAELIDLGKGGLWRLTEAHILREFRGIRSDLIAIAHAAYVSELTSSLIREGEESLKAYQFLQSTLEKLDEAPLSSLELRIFEVGILRLSGLVPTLSNCLVCGAREKANFFFDFDQGGLVCQDCHPSDHSKGINPELCEVLAAIDSGNHLGKTDKYSMRTARWILAKVIDQNLCRELKAREFLRNLVEDSVACYD
jgi:DNA repair protein RecO (recombination protein O)